MLPKMSPCLGECTQECLSCGLASDAGSSITPVPLPAPLLIPDMLHAPRTLLAPEPAALKMAQGFPMAWQGSLAAALLLAQAMFGGLWCPGCVHISWDTGHSLGVLHPCHGMNVCCRVGCLLVEEQPSSELSQFELCQAIPMLSIILMKSEPGPLIFWTCFHSQQHQTQPWDTSNQSRVAGRHSSSSPCCFGSGLFCFVVSPMSGGCCAQS